MAAYLKTPRQVKRLKIKEQLENVNDEIDKMIVKDLYMTQPEKYQRLQKLHLTLRTEYDILTSR